MSGSSEWSRRTLYLLLLSLLCASALADLSDSDISALEDLYTSTAGDAWTHSDNWNSGDPCVDAWYGIQCNEDNDAILEILLPSNNLSGILPDSVGDISTLGNVDLSDNNLSGAVPDWLESEPDFDVNVSDNCFDCPTPDWCSDDMCQNSDECECEGGFFQFIDTAGAYISFDDITVIIFSLAVILCMFLSLLHGLRLPSKSDADDFSANIILDPPADGFTGDDFDNVLLDDEEVL